MLCSHTTSRNQIALALVGLGNVHFWHTKAIAKLSQFSISALCDHNPAKRPPDVAHPFFSTVEELLDNATCDAVVVATPARKQFLAAACALKAGKHVLLEKPGAFDRDDLLKLYEMADMAGVRLVPNQA